MFYQIVACTAHSKTYYFDWEVIFLHLQDINIYQFYMINNFFVLSEKFFLKRKGLSDGSVVQITKKEYDIGLNILKKICVANI